MRRTLILYAIAAVAAMEGMDHGDHGDHGNMDHGSAMEKSGCGFLDSLPTDLPSCINGFYPLFPTPALAIAASPSSGYHNYTFNGWELYMPNGYMPMQMTEGASCGAWLDATALANLTHGPICVNKMRPLYTSSCAALAASSEHSTHYHTVGNFTLYMPDPMHTDGACPMDMMDMMSTILSSVGGSMAGDMDHEDHDHDHGGHDGHGDDMSGGDMDGDADPEDKKDPCFPATAMVSMANGAPIRIDALKEGDEIVAAAADGTLTTDTVSLLSITKPEARASFVALTTDAGTALTLTPEHHLPVGAACCSTLQKAKDVAVGETLWLATPGGAATTAARVVHKTLTLGEGLYSPVLTHGAFPVVDGVVTSFDTLAVVQLASALLPWLAPLCRATATCSLLRPTISTEAPSVTLKAALALEPLAASIAK